MALGLRIDVSLAPSRQLDGGAAWPAGVSAPSGEQFVTFNGDPVTYNGERVVAPIGI
jgi:hypothetical protein